MNNLDLQAVMQYLADAAAREAQLAESPGQDEMSARLASERAKVYLIVIQAFQAGLPKGDGSSGSRLALDGPHYFSSSGTVSFATEDMMADLVIAEGRGGSVRRPKPWVCDGCGREIPGDTWHACNYPGGEGIGGEHEEGR